MLLLTVLRLSDGMLNAATDPERTMAPPPLPSDGIQPDGTAADSRPADADADADGGNPGGGGTGGEETTPSGPTAHWQPFIAGLRAFVRRRVPAGDADDVAQEVMLRLHQGADSLRHAGRAEAWVFGVARRAVADYYRSGDYRARRDGEPLGDDAEAVAAGDGPEAGPRGFASFAGDHSTHEEVLTWLRPMAEELPAPYRDALVMADFEGHTQRRVADELGLSLSGAKSRVQRARRLLGERLRQCCRLELDGSGRVVDFERQEECCDC